MQPKPLKSKRLDAPCALSFAPRQFLAVGGVISASLLCLVLSGCCGSGGSSSSSSSSSSDTPAPTGGPRVTKVTFAKSLNEQMQPQIPTEAFLPHEKVNLSITVAGRPRKGTVKAQFFHLDKSIGDVSVDLSKINKGTLFSIGQSTFVGFWYEHQQPLPVGVGYKVDVAVNGQPTGSYTFKVLAPAGAIPSKVHSATLAKGMTPDRTPVMPSKVFGPTETVHLLGRLDLGLQNWLEADWYANGQPMPHATKSLTARENISNQPFFFTVPMKGWPAGQHKAVLIVNGAVVAEYPFVLAGAPAPGQMPVAPGQLPQPGASFPGKVKTPPAAYPPAPGQIPPAPMPPAPAPPTKSY